MASATSAGTPSRWQGTGERMGGGFSYEHQARPRDGEEQVRGGVVASATGASTPSRWKQVRGGVVASATSAGTPS